MPVCVFSDICCGSAPLRPTFVDTAAMGQKEQENESLIAASVRAWKARKEVESDGSTTDEPALDLFGGPEPKLDEETTTLLRMFSLR